MSAQYEMNHMSHPQPGADMFHDHLDVLRSTNEDRYGRFLATSDDIIFRNYEPSPFYKAYEELVVMRSGFTTLTPGEERRTFADLRIGSARAALGRAICSAEVATDDLPAITHDTVESIKAIGGTRRMPRKIRHQLHTMTYAVASDRRMLDRGTEVRNNLPHSLWNGLDADALANVGKLYLF